MDWQKEIEQLHQFFVAWFHGDLPKTREAFARFVDVLHPGFVMVTPNGRLLPYTEISDLLYESHGSRPDVEIRIKNPTLTYHAPFVLIATYEEHQYSGTKESARLSTAVFRPDLNQPNGVEWMHVHETWIDPIA